MPSWWPFGRKRRKSKKAKKEQAANEKAIARQTYTPEKPLVQPSDPPSHQKPLLHDTQGSSRADSRQDYNEKAALSPQPTHTPPQENTHAETLGEPSAEEDISSLPVNKQFEQQLERSPHLRPVQETPVPESPTPSKTNRSIDEPKSQRRLSRKAKQDDPNRHSQVRALSSPIPIPKRTGQDSRLSRRGSKRLREGLQNESVVSLPQAASIRSSVTVMSEKNYEVGSVDVFSPRPTIRYSLQSSLATPALRSPTNHSRNGSRRDMGSPERRNLRESKTIDTLADDYDTGTLRELMDRDQKRKDRKRKAEEDRAKRRLERHAARSSEAGPSRPRERPRSRRKEREEERPKDQSEGLGLTGLEAPTALERSSPKPEVPPKSAERRKDLGPIKTTDAAAQLRREPETASSTASPVEEPIVATATEVRYSQASMSPPASPARHARHESSISQMAEGPAPEGTLNVLGTDPESRKRASDTPARRGGALASLFKRSAPPRPEGERPEGTTGTSFSNTSRESMRGQVPLHLREPAPRPRSGTPTRTMSKFREDLPELPVSPPESRMQSPEVPNIGESSLSERQKGKLPESSKLTMHNLEQQDRQRDSIGSSAPVSAAPMSQSLASVDSEGSWLSSSRQKKRGSQQMPGTSGTLQEGREAETNTYQTTSLTSNNLMSLTQEAGESKVQAQSREQPSIETVTQDQGHSSEQARAHEESARNESSGAHAEQQAPEVGERSPSSPEESPTVVTGHLVTQAHHARAVSGGSAKLLDIPSKRGSVRSIQGSTPPPE